MTQTSWVKMSNPLESSFKPDASFFERVRSLRSAKTIVRALPRWCKENNTTVSLHFVAGPEGVEIQLGWPEGTTEETANAALKAMADTEQLMEMESIIQHLTYFGGSPELMPDIINQLVGEAEDFARKIHPEGEVLPGFDALHQGKAGD
jgi:hypothetical protein